MGSQPSVDTQVSPVKRTKADETPGTQGCNETPAKQRRVSNVRAPPPTTDSEFDEKVLEEASRADMLAQLRNLAGRPDVLALGRSSQELLNALKANGGMVNAAKRALLTSRRFGHDECGSSAQLDVILELGGDRA